MIYLLQFILILATQLSYFRIANRLNIIDKPNQRSSHTKVTLRGGGIVFYFSVLFYFLLQGFQYPWFLLGLTLIAGISFADDIKPRSSKLRLLIHFIAMAFMFYQLGLFKLPWYFTLIALIVSTGILNGYNFMDGINGTIVHRIALKENIFEAHRKHMYQIMANELKIPLVVVSGRLN